MPLHVSSTCVHHQEVKIALHSLWCHHTETSEWSKITKIQFYKYEQIVVKFMYEFFRCDYCVLLTVNMLCYVEVMFIQLLNLLERYYVNKLIVKQNFCASSWLITEIKNYLCLFTSFI